MGSLDTRETTVLLEKMDKVTAILAPIQNHLEQEKPSEQRVPRSSCSAPPTTLTWEAPPTFPRTQLHLLCEEVPRFLLKENSRLRDLKIWEQQTMGCSSFCMLFSSSLSSGSSLVSPSSRKPSQMSPAYTGLFLS